MQIQELVVDILRGSKPVLWRFLFHPFFLVDVKPSPKMGPKKTFRVGGLLCCLTKFE